MLTAFGIGPGYLAWLRLLYSEPKAKLRINNTLSSTFSLSIGTRQSCPLSPLLFGLAIEPLVLAIRQTSGIIGFCRAGGEDKIALYEDDDLIFLGDTANSLIAIMNLISRSGSFFGFQINLKKSILLLLDDLKSPLHNSASQIQIAYTVKYLGVEVSQNVKD